MSQEIASMHAKITADSAGFQSALGALGDSLGGLGGIIGGLSIGGFFAAAVGAASDTQTSLAQLDAVLRSTSGGNDALNASMHMTRDELVQLAQNFEGNTRYTKGQTLAAEEMLLTFKGIGKDVFPLVTQTALDMSQALGQDLKSSSIQLGKALDDPIKGISALTRVGVTFSDAQKAQIKAFQDSNQLAKAQGVILNELQSEFGGSAEAAGSTFAGSLDILKNTFGELLEKIGNVFLPVLQNVVTGITDIVNSITQSNPDFLTFAGTAVIVAGGLALIPTVLTVIGGILGVILSPIGLIVGAVIGLKLAFDNNFMGITDTANKLIAQLTPGFNTLKDLVTGFVDTLTGGGDQKQQTIEFKQTSRRVGGAMGDDDPGNAPTMTKNIGAADQSFGARLKLAVEGAAPVVLKAVNTLVTNIWTWITTDGVTLLQGGVATLMDWGGKILAALPDVITGLLGIVKGAIAWIASDGAKLAGEGIRTLFDIGASLVEALPGAVAAIGKFFSDLFSGTGGGGASSDGKGRGSAKGGGIGAVITGMVTSAVDWLANEGKTLFVNAVAGFLGVDPSVVTGELNKFLAPIQNLIGDAGGVVGKALDDGKKLIAGFISAFDAVATGIGKAFQGVADIITAPFRSAINAIGQILVSVGQSTGIFNALIAPGQQLIAFAGAKAGGGPVSGGMSYLVGEKGPELFTPGTSGNITPNSALGKGSGANGRGGGGSISIGQMTINGVTDASKFLDQLMAEATRRNISLNGGQV